MKTQEERARLLKELSRKTREKKYEIRDKARKGQPVSDLDYSALHQLQSAVRYNGIILAYLKKPLKDLELTPKITFHQFNRFVDWVQEKGIEQKWRPGNELSIYSLHNHL